MLQIRPAAKSEVARFFRTVVRTRMRSITELFSADRLEMADECIVAVLDGKIVGATCLVFDTGDGAELATEYVLKEYQGEGIGTRLTRAGIERLIALGKTPIHVDVASEAMDSTLDRLPRKDRRHLRLKRSYLKYGEVDLPER
ncbi:MAG: GNAT family N-acetyltransferase [Planctomycetia bacterium]|nr:GNAT family N-acetyltransferase [Planctomycetia bacterium]